MIDALKQLDLVAFMEGNWQAHFKKEGKSFVALSPFRKEKTPSLYVHRESDGHWVYYDHGVGRGGTILDAVMEYDGHNDTRLAIETAKRMARDVGLLGMGEERSGRPDLEGLLEKLSGHETKTARDYLLGRRLSPELVEEMIKTRTVVVNLWNDSTYCCFAVRDATGKLRSLFNRKIEGSSAREKFLLGEQYPFCPDWQKLDNAPKVHLCEGIVDALSMLTLNPDACVIALPGAHYDLKTPEILSEKMTLVEAFDNDEAGRAAAKRLGRTFPRHEIESFDLKGTHDVNDLLCVGGGPSSGKLSTKDRIEIVINDKPSRELGERYKVHHSRICRLRQEAAQALSELWDPRRPGRKPNPKPTGECDSIRKELEASQRRSELQAMRIDWLELKVEIEEKRTEEAARTAKARKKKRGRRQSK